jgi:UDPglucose 6-dehydrogenase
VKISVFGTGYVGLVTGTCFAEMGNDVICADIDVQKIEKLKKGVSPIYEPGLEELIASNTKDRRLEFTTDLKHTVESSELLFIAVGTPSDQDGSADLRYVLEVAKTIGQTMSTPKVIISKSTVPIGTYSKVKETIAHQLALRNLKIEFDVVSNPEFLKEGTAVEDCLRPSRVVVGVETPRAKEAMTRLYEPFVRNGHPILFMDPISSEMTKYAANAMLATKISFMNELSRVCEKTGADIAAVRQGIGSDPRIGYSFIYPGLGYGGSCLPKDVKALIKTAELLDEPLSILKAVEAVNQSQRQRFLEKILSELGTQLHSKRIAIWGLAFKPGTDDIREAPALFLVRELVKLGAEVVAHDPVAIAAARAELGNLNGKLRMAESNYDAVDGADALCVCTEWKPYREPDFKRIKELMRTPNLFDGRNLYSRHTLTELGFSYYAVGRSQ